MVHIDPAARPLRSGCAARCGGPPRGRDCWRCRPRRRTRCPRSRRSSPTSASAGAGRRLRRRAQRHGLLAAAGLGVAVANASTDVREAADVLTACNDDDGVAAWLEGMCLCHV
ncbi:HAD hydrolase family protein [Streptomyces mirabilis]|nr:HAD hydrolase family protein [Streptomyces mirabilis]